MIPKQTSCLPIIISPGTPDSRGNNQGMVTWKFGIESTVSSDDHRNCILAFLGQIPKNYWLKGFPVSIAGTGGVSGHDEWCTICVGDDGLSANE